MILDDVQKGRPFTEYAAAQAAIEGIGSPAVGMIAVGTDNEELGIYVGGAWKWYTKDHGELSGLGDDDHTQYLLADGSRALAGAWNMGNQNLTNVDIDSGDINVAVTQTEWDAAYAHISQSGVSHTYIDQDVTSIGAPIFSKVSIDDANFYLDIVNHPSIYFDSGDYIRYNRTGDYLYFSIGDSTKLTLYSGGYAQFNSAAHFLRFYETDGTVNKRMYGFSAYTDKLSINARNDAGVLVRELLKIEHDGDVTVHNSLSVTKGVVINEGGGNYDTRIEGDTDVNLVYIDASTDKVGFGISSPTDKLHVAGHVLATSGFHVGVDSTDNLIDDASNGTGRVTMYIGNGEIQIDTPSDENIKDIIGKTNTVLQDLLDWRVVDYTFKSIFMDDTKTVHTGLIAQDVEKRAPDSVHTRTDNWKSIKSNTLIPYLVKAIQEQQEQIEILQKKVGIKGEIKQ